jgi:hypothetical protein
MHQVSQRYRVASHGLRQVRVLLQLRVHSQGAWRDRACPHLAHGRENLTVPGAEEIFRRHETEHVIVSFWVSQHRAQQGLLGPDLGPHRYHLAAGRTPGRPAAPGSAGAPQG